MARNRLFPSLCRPSPTGPEWGALSWRIQNNGTRAVMRPFSKDWFVCREKKSSGIHCEKTRLLLTMALMKLLESSYQEEKTLSSRRRGEEEKWKAINCQIILQAQCSGEDKGRHASWMPNYIGWSLKMSLQREILKKMREGQLSCRWAFSKEFEVDWV